MKQLEAAGPIQLAATRMVSGILEQRYRARQRDLRLSAALFRQQADETEAVVRSAFGAFLTGIFDRARTQDWPSDGPDKPVLLAFDDRVSPEAAARIRARREEVTREIARVAVVTAGLPFRCIRGLDRMGADRSERTPPGTRLRSPAGPRLARLPDPLLVREPDFLPGKTSRRPHAFERQLIRATELLFLVTPPAAFDHIFASSIFPETERLEPSPTGSGNGFS